MKIEFNNVSYSYDNKNNVLSDINLLFDKNEIIFIMGESGSGKSTLIQHLNGLLIPSSGEVIVSISDSNYIIKKNYKEKKIFEVRKNCGMLFQFPENQLFEISVLKDVMFGPLNFFSDEEKAKESAINALEKMNIDKSYYDRSPLELSGGEKRKIAIAGVLSYNPNIIVLDEPTASLDPNSREELMKFLVELKNEGKCIIIVSHDENLAYEYGDKLIVLSEGKILSYDDPYKVFLNEDILSSANLKMPFVLKTLIYINNKDVNYNIKNVEQLSSFLRSDKNE